MQMPIAWLAATLALTAVACAADDLADGRDDEVITDGKADAFGLRDGTYEAAAILQVVNGLPVGYLTRERWLTEAVELAPDMARRLVAHGTFSTLTELDGVPYTGRAFFRKLLTFVRDNDRIGRCGDGEVQSLSGPEECDPADGAWDAPSCTATCTFGPPDGCGDGRVDHAIEACDDGNLAADDGCSSRCRLDVVIGGDVDLGSARHVAWGGRDVDGTGPVELEARLRLDRPARVGIDVAITRTTPQGESTSAWTDFLAWEVAGRLGFAIDDGDGVNAEVILDGVAHVVNASDNVGILAAPAARWDRIVDLPEGATTIGVRVSGWARPIATWLGLSVIIRELPAAVCGDGVRSGGEPCDDGNQVDGDGCTRACTLDTYREANDALNDFEPENARPYRLVRGVFDDERLDLGDAMVPDQDLYLFELAEPMVAELYSSGGSPAACEQFDGMIERMRLGAYDDADVRDRSPEPAADGCASLAIPAGVHVLRVRESTPSDQRWVYELRLRWP
jgi:cysteine-rich repeat protein